MLFIMKNHILLGYLIHRNKPTTNSGRLYRREEKYQAAVAAGTTTSVAWEAVRPIE